MRPLLSLLITLGLLGGVFAYVRFADSVRRAAVEVEIDYAEGLYSIEIQTTFDCLADPIFESPALRVLFKGEPVFSSDERIAADQTTVIQPLEGVESGENEIFISANFGSASSGLQVIKVTVKRNDIPVVEKLLTSETGISTVRGPVVFEIAPRNTAEVEKH